MRRHRHWLVTLVLGAVLAVPVACDDDATGVQIGDLVGTWTLTRARDCEFDTGSGNWGTLTIQSNGTFTFATIDEDYDEGTISISGSTMTITSTVNETSHTVSFSLTGDTLVITDARDPGCPEVDTFVRD
jgi:VCBS repeat-containing protein